MRKLLFSEKHFCPKVRPVTEDALFIHFNCYIPQICEFIMSMRKCFYFFQNDTFLARICKNRYFQSTIFAQKCVRSLNMHTHTHNWSLKMHTHTHNYEQESKVVVNHDLVLLLEINMNIISV